jgi:hypothetical protein
LAMSTRPQGRIYRSDPIPSARPSVGANQSLTGRQINDVSYISPRAAPVVFARLQVPRTRLCIDTSQMCRRSAGKRSETSVAALASPTSRGPSVARPHLYVRSVVNPSLSATCTTSIDGGVKALSRPFDLGQNLMFARGLSFDGDPVRKFLESRRVKDSKKGA